MAFWTAPLWLRSCLWRFIQDRFPDSNWLLHGYSWPYNSHVVFFNEDDSGRSSLWEKDTTTTSSIFTYLAVHFHDEHCMGWLSHGETGETAAPRTVPFRIPQSISPFWVPQGGLRVFGPTGVDDFPASKHRYRSSMAALLDHKASPTHPQAIRAS